jgi:FRG domain
LYESDTGGNGTTKYQATIAMTTDKVSALGRFLDYVSDARARWRIVDDKELWFRGESCDYQNTLLRPELYRPPERDALRHVDDLLDIESSLYEEFMRWAEQFRGEALDRKYWRWDAYILMQHHGGATRLLDWSDGALMALHFAVRNPQDDAKKADAFVYVLEPDRLNQRLKAFHNDTGIAEKWRAFVKNKHPRGLNEEEWEDAYLPSNNEERAEFAIPSVPLIPEFPLLHAAWRATQSLPYFRNGL